MKRTFELLDRDKRRVAKLRSLLAEQHGTSPEIRELIATIHSLEKGFDPPVCALEFRNLVRHD